MGVIYKITSPSGRIYIGKTVDWKDRLRKYRNLKTESQPRLHRSFNKYGFDSHVIEIILEVPDEQLNEMEIKMIEIYNSFDKRKGMNCTKGGEGILGLRHKMGSIEKMSASSTGKVHSDETKLKIGMAGKGRVVSRAAREKSSLSQSGEKNHRYGKGLIPVLQYNKKGEFVSEFSSVKEAANYFNCSGTSITAVCRGREKSHMGFVFKYKDGGAINNNKSKPLLCFINSYKLEYESVSSACNDLSLSVKTIRRAVKSNLKPIRTGHVFIYKDIYESLNLDN